MIKATDLKIHDLVLVGGEVKRVSAFNADEVFFGYNERARFADIDGVKITEEGLLNNKFTAKKSKGETNYNLDVVDIKKVDSEDFYRVSIRNDIYMYFGFLNYWHELEHALCDCALSARFNV